MNLLLMTDSYKASHYLQYPPGTQGMFSYLESRGGKFDRTVFFGLQYLIQEYLSKPITLQDISEAEAFFKAHGTPFPRDGWLRILQKHKGYLPVRIKAVAEGSVVPTHNVLMAVESTDPECFWVVTWIEAFLMRLWYPITVATQSFHIKRMILAYLERTADNPGAEINFKLHDFGARGVSSGESAAIGGAAHLVNFMGSDTVEGVVLANKHYDCDMAAFSIPAAEHSTITSWGKEHEYDAFRNMLKQFSGSGKLVACVSDSFDIYKAVDFWMSISEEIKASGAKLVIRPDSGDPCDVVMTIMDKMKPLMTENSKGYLVLPSHFGVIQGDGVDFNSIGGILDAMYEAGYSASNIAFGMGGALLQKLNRDTQKFAYKCSSVKVDGQWMDVYKDPVTDPGKVSKKGRLDLLCEGGKYRTIVGTQWDSVLETVYMEGPAIMHRPQTLLEIRSRVDGAL